MEVYVENDVRILFVLFLKIIHHMQTIYIIVMKRQIRTLLCAALRRNEAAGWLRKMIGVVAARDLPAEPSEEEFRLGLRSGIILCNVLNKVQAGSVQKVHLCSEN